MAVAEGWQDTSQPSLDLVYEASTLDTVQERERLTQALEEAAAEFRRFSKRFAASSQKESAAIFDLYSHLLNDARLKRELFAQIDAGSVAEWAVKQVVEQFAAQFASLQDTYMRERASDLRALGQRLLFHLDDSTSGASQWPERFILVADELTATLLAEVPQDRLAGVVVRDGAANSHAAILVRAMGIPTVMGADIQPALLNQRLLIVDGYRGEVLVDPEPVLVKEYQRLVTEEIELSKLAEDDVEQPAALKSGERIQVMLNAGLSPEHEQLLGGGLMVLVYIALKSLLCCKAAFRRKRNKLRNIKACYSFILTNPSHYVPWISVPINSCPTCPSAKKTRVWVGVGSV